MAKKTIEEAVKDWIDKNFSYQTVRSEYDIRWRDNNWQNNGVNSNVGYSFDELMEFIAWDFKVPPTKTAHAAIAAWARKPLVRVTPFPYSGEMGRAFGL